jgi:zinc/manganese transport system substrate-binding protein/manganese/iron transport system substrate-binding protein
MKDKQRLGMLAIIILMLMVGCGGDGNRTAESPADENAHEGEIEMLLLPELTAVELNGEPLQVIATTSIIGDVVAQVGGQTIALTVLIGAGQDPHSYEPGAQDLTAVANADIIFVNGWNLEEGLLANLEAIGEEVPIVPVAANIQPLAFGEDEHQEEVADEAEEEHGQGGADPHTWQSIQNVKQWVENIQQSLSSLDPANAERYRQNAEAYLAELAELEGYAESEMTAVPPEKRVLVTNHDALAYFARDYDFEILGTVIPGASTLAEPSASDLAALIATMNEHNVCTIFTETIVSDSLAQTVAAELDHCDEVQVLSLYTDALGEPGSGADSYIGIFRANVDAIVAGLGG